MKSKKGGTAGNVFARPLHENAGMDKDFFYSIKNLCKIDNDIDKCKCTFEKYSARAGEGKILRVHE